jgi:hypothetical protein
MTIFPNSPGGLKEMAIAIQDFSCHPHTFTNTARNLKFTANRRLFSKRNASRHAEN